MDADLHEALYSAATRRQGGGAPSAGKVNSFRIQLREFLESLPSEFQAMAVCDLAEALDSLWTD